VSGCRGPAAVVALAQDSGTILPGDPSTAPQEADPTVQPPEGLVTVGDVRVGTHDTFDRITFDLVGGGAPGHRIAYTDEPVGDASGLPVEVAGATALRVVLIGVANPGDEPQGVETFLDDVAGPDGLAILEVVNESVFEGYHTFFVGLDEQLPYVVGRLEDPTRLVIDLVRAPAGDDGTEGADGTGADHGSEPTDETEPTTDATEEVPAGGVEAGDGGSAGVHLSFRSWSGSVVCSRSSVGPPRSMPAGGVSRADAAQVPRRPLWAGTPATGRGRRMRRPPMASTVGDTVSDRGRPPCGGAFRRVTRRSHDDRTDDDDASVGHPEHGRHRHAEGDPGDPARDGL
jgi:hypothetical protein